MLPQQPLSRQLAQLTHVRRVRCDETKAHLNVLFDALQYALAVNEELFPEPRLVTHGRLSMCRVWSELCHCAQTLHDDAAFEALRYCLQWALQEKGWTLKHQQALEEGVERAAALDRSLQQMTALGRQAMQIVHDAETLLKTQ